MNVTFNWESAEAMPIRSAACLGIVLLSAAAHAAEPPAVEESWESAFVEDARVGFLHTVVRPAEGDGAKRLRATAELELTFRRQNAPVRVRMEHGTEETADGKVVAVFMRQFHERGQQLALEGALEGERMHVVVDRGRIERHLRWPADVVGLYHREHLFEERKPKPGDRFTFLAYEPTVNAVVTVRVLVREPEAVVLDGKKQALLRVEMTPDKIEAPGASVRLPASVWWLDENFTPRRRQIELDGLGAVTLTRTTREQATQPATLGRLTDVGLKTLVPLNRPVAHPYATRSAVYRITLRGDGDPATALANDGHQEVKNLRGDSFELHVHPVRPRPARDGFEAAPAEFLGSSQFIPADDPKVKELARQAAGAETDAWKKALRVEQWVKQHMRVDNAAPLVPASQTARDLRGDCRMFALLTAALCRAEGIPARTAVGLVYVEKPGQKPGMGFHMWTEVFVDGQWLGLDATLGRGGVGATHVKIADHSWHEVRSLTPLLPVARVLGKMTIEVVRVEGE